MGLFIVTKLFLWKHTQSTTISYKTKYKHAEEERLLGIIRHLAQDSDLVVGTT
jgi:hypothetical protein